MSFFIPDSIPLDAKGEYLLFNKTYTGALGSY